MPSLCALVAIDLDHFLLLHPGSPECGAVVDLSRIRLVSAFLDAAHDILAHGHLDPVFGPSEAGADVPRL